MNPIRAIRRAASILTALAAGLLALATTAPAALARPDPPSVTPTALATLRSQPPGWNKHPPLPAHAHALAPGGMPSWQITLIVIMAAIALAAAGVLVTRARARTARRQPTATAA
jgi:hypothetical protein